MPSKLYVRCPQQAFSRCVRSVHRAPHPGSHSAAARCGWVTQKIAVEECNGNQVNWAHAGRQDDAFHQYASYKLRNVRKIKVR